MEITPEMEIVRERVLSLIPKKENGKFAHGALKGFANSIGLKSGNLISDWINFRSCSYMNYLYEIAAKYNVSVEWLKGETDIKNPASETETGRDETIQILVDEIENMSPVTGTRAGAIDFQWFPLFPLSLNGFRISLYMKTLQIRKNNY